MTGEVAKRSGGDHLVTLLELGDEQAKNRFYGQHHDYLNLVLLKWANQRLPVYDLPEGELEEIVEDAVSDAIVDAIRNIRSYDPERASVRTWLVEIAWSRLRRTFERARERALARRRKLVPPEKAEMLADPKPGPEQALLQREFRREIFGILGVLRPRHQMAILLVDYFKYPVSTLQAELGLPSYEAASSLVIRARGAFRRRWRERKS